MRTTVRCRSFSALPWSDADAANDLEANEMLYNNRRLRFREIQDVWGSHVPCVPLECQVVKVLHISVLVSTDTDAPNGTNRSPRTLQPSLRQDDK